MILIIVSGRSGSGKSVALRTLEDMNFYCVDNLPIILLPKLINIFAEKKTPIAISVDIRNIPKNIEIFKKTLKKTSVILSIKLLFLDADKKTIIRRYNDTRRLHPLSKNHLSLENAIDKENKLLELIRSKADLIINTNNMSVHELSKILKKLILNNQNNKLIMLFESFGFKYGIPTNADYVFDVRFLPNPYWNLKLRSMTGLDKPVSVFLKKYTEVNEFIYKTSNYLELWLPMLELNNRNYLTIAIGCTGGKHRSVYITDKIAKYFRLKGKNVQIYHRILKKKY